VRHGAEARALCYRYWAAQAVLVVTGLTLTALALQIVRWVRRHYWAVQAVLSSPGIPDFYQGTEFWDLSLVDPDNRRPVDFGARMEALSSEEEIAELAGHWQNGRIKQAIIRRGLAFRHAFPALFSRGHYLPLSAEGPASDHIIAFARVVGQEAAVTVVTRFATRLLSADSGILIPGASWENTDLRLPAKIAPCFWNVLSGAELATTDDCIPLSSLLKDLPVALLTTQKPKA
jgi:(1->4)-alpha-D-glucan 1-alpha-D-glucosylmutase